MWQVDRAVGQITSRRSFRLVPRTVRNATATLGSDLEMPLEIAWKKQKGRCFCTGPDLRFLGWWDALKTL